MNRREFLAALSATPAFQRSGSPVLRNLTGEEVRTVKGSILPRHLGVTLIHEHIMVDFIGADQASPTRYHREEVFRIARVHLEDLKKRGCNTLVECTPAYLGRDPELLKRLSLDSGMNIVTNTGYYGAAKDKYVPEHAFQESAQQLADRWTAEARMGIGDTRIQPGFIKSGVDAGPLSEIDRKLITAAAMCHARTGLTIHVHTGNGEAAMQIITRLRELRISPKAYVWVHAQNEKDRSIHFAAAEQGAWVEFDGIRESTAGDHLQAVMDMVGKGYLRQILISQDAGWYHVGEPGGGNFRGYTYLFDEFVPALTQAGITHDQIKTLLVQNPAEALKVIVRRLRD